MASRRFFVILGVFTIYDRGVRGELIVIALIIAVILAAGRALKYVLSGE